MPLCDDDDGAIYAAEHIRVLNGHYGALSTAHGASTSDCGYHARREVGRYVRPAGDDAAAGEMTTGDR